MPDYLIPLPAADTLFGAAAEEFPEIAKTPQQKKDYEEIKRDLRLDPTEDLKDLTLTGFDDAQTKLKLDHADAEYNDRFATMMGTIEGWLHTKQDVDRKWGLIAQMRSLLWTGPMRGSFTVSPLRCSYSKTPLSFLVLT